MIDTFEVDTPVVVICTVDDTVSIHWIGKVGRIVHTDYLCGCADYLCGCGQSPGDPMIGVRFPDGSVKEFWKEELDYYR